MARLDPHSYADDTQPRVVSLSWDARVSFDRRVLDAEATLTLDAPGRGPLDLDTRDLTVRGARDDQGREVPFALAPADPILGAKLTLSLAEGTRAVTLSYSTSPEASALQWLTPAQTAGGAQPYLFSQCQAIHARSVIPLQDTPRHRITFTASLTVPAPLRALMAAAHVSREVTGDVAVERWEMPQAIPPYLIALAVGELASRELGPRSRVWAEPSVVDAAAWEFEGVEAMMAAGEALFGPYAWDRYDILVMPPSFPYGGMENPRLTFVTPTLLAGDRSQVRVIAHELAHAWSGNLVTNADAQHFWLNEGWTRYAEIRIVEAIEGEDMAALSSALCRKGLDDAVARFRAQGRPELTRLRVSLEGVDPDDAFSEVPYDKGNLFLRAIEARVGRPRFDAFARAYFDAHRFTSITTDAFIAFAQRELPGALEAVRWREWVDGEGVPDDAPVTRSAMLDRVEALGSAAPDDAAGRAMSSTEWQLYLDRLPRETDHALLRDLDARFALSQTGNMEVKVAWLELALASGYAPALPEVERVLCAVGRMKYLKPLYDGLLARAETRPVAASTFERAAEGYHPIARAVIRARIERALGR
ncbi:MAG: M1 family metallopeptidase [Polyangiales bacterium]